MNLFRFLESDPRTPNTISIPVRRLGFSKFVYVERKENVMCKANKIARKIVG